MQYVLMIHAAEARFGQMSSQERDALTGAYMAYTKELVASGCAGDRAALEGTQTATVVQVRDGKRIVKDGPFAETREQLGGYYAVDAATEEEALAWAEKIPSAKLGTIEVRPLGEGGAGAPAAPSPAAKSSKEYLFLLYEPEARFAKLSQAELGATMESYRVFTKSLIDGGHMVSGNQLGSVRTAKSISVASGKRVVQDGPFAETREQLGGYYRVRARDLDEAIALAARIPAATTGSIEIRPLVDMSKYD